MLHNCPSAPSYPPCCCSGRVCSIELHDTTVYVGDYSSTVKVFDLRQLSAPPRHLPNALIFAGK